MSYATIAKAAVGTMFAAADYQQLADNFAANPPDVITASGQLPVATGANAIGAQAAGSASTALTADSTQATGLAWTGGVVPVGMIVIWSGSVGTIPGGWQICDGTNGTPDLRGRFVVGAGSGYAVNATGGAAAINLAHTHTPTATATSSDAFSHTHTQGVMTGGSHSHTVGTLATGAPSATLSATTVTGGHITSTNTHTHPVSAVGTATHTHANPTTGSAGSAHSHTVGDTVSAGSPAQSVLPPYYALCYIMRVS